MSDQKLGRSESRGARRCVVTPSSATQRWDKDTPAWGWVNGRTGEKRRNETRGEAIALTPLAARRAQAWPFISATCEDERGGREGKVEGGPPQAIVCCLAWSRPAKWGSDRGGLLRGSAVSRKSKEKERKKKTGCNSVWHPCSPLTNQVPKHRPSWSKETINIGHRSRGWQLTAFPIEIHQVRDRSHLRPRCTVNAEGGGKRKKTHTKESVKSPIQIDN